MISIVKAGVDPEKKSGSRIIDALNDEFSEVPQVSCIRKLIVVRKIDPEEFEDQEVDNMGREEDDIEMTQEEIDALEKEIPDEIDKLSMEELGLTEDDLDDLEDFEAGEDSDGEDMSDEETCRTRERDSSRS